MTKSPPTGRFRCRPSVRTALAVLCCGLVAVVLGLPRPGVAADAAKGLADLKGFTEATLGVSQLTPDGVHCGLQLDHISEAAQRTIGNAGLTLQDGAPNRLTVSAVSARVGPDQCATAVLLGAYAKESFFSATAGWVQSGYVVLWQRSVMVATPIGQHAAAVVDATRRLGTQMMADWRAQNPQPARADQRPPEAAPASNPQTTAQVTAAPARTTQ